MSWIYYFLLKTLEFLKQYLVKGVSRLSEHLSMVDYCGPRKLSNLETMMKPNSDLLRAEKITK